MNAPGMLEDIISRAGSSGWDFFDKLPDDIRQRVELQQAKVTEDRETIARAWANFASTPDGQKALQAMFDQTINRTVFFVNLSQDPAAMAMWGCFREGQNALAHEIARQIARGRQSEEQPKPRDI